MMHLSSAGETRMVEVSRLHRPVGYTEQKNRNFAYEPLPIPRQNLKWLAYTLAAFGSELLSELIRYPSA